MPKKNNANGNIEIYLEDVRLSYPHLFVPKPYKNDKNSNPRFSASFILDKKKHRDLIDEIDDAIEAVKDAKWGDDQPRIKADKICFSDGDDADQAEYQGGMILRSASPENKPPKVIDKNKEELDERSGKPYGGCYVNAIVRIYAFDEYGPQINCSLEAVQFFRKGESFGPAPVDVDKKFKDHGDDDDDVKPMRRSRKSRDDDDDGDDRKTSRRRSRDDDEDEGESRPSRSRRSREDDDEDDRKSTRSRRSREDDEDAPRSRRSRAQEDDDDEAETPARRRGRGRDEDDDETPRRRRSSRDDD